MRTIAIAAAFALSIVSLSNIAHAASSSPVGKWRGGGVLTPHDGARERARCRVDIQKAEGHGAYNAYLQCSTSGGMIIHKSRLKKVGSNRYRGTFYNAEHNVRGTVSTTVNGNRQSVKLLSNKGSGRLSLRR